MATRFSDGTLLAALRWAGPAVALAATRGGRLVRRGDDVFLAADGTLTRIRGAFTAWPPVLDAPERHDAAGATVREVVALPDGDLLCSSATSTQRWRPGAPVDAPPTLPVARCEVTPGGGLYTLLWKPKSLVIEHRAALSFDAPPRKVAEIDRALAPSLPACVLADGTLVVALVDAKYLGDVGLVHILEPRGLRDTPAAAPWQRSHASLATFGFTWAHAGGVTVQRTKLLVRGPDNFFLASPRGFWFFSGGPDQAAFLQQVVDGRPESAHDHVLSTGCAMRVLAACPLGGLIAVVAATPDGLAVAITDGGLTRWVDGALGHGAKLDEPASVLASPNGDALLVAYAGGLARCDLLGEGDARALLPAYTDKPAPALPPEARRREGLWAAREPTTFSDGSVVASLRWAGPPTPCAGHQALLARCGEQVILVSDHTLTPLGDALSMWPIEPGRRENHGTPTNYRPPVTQLTLRDGGEVLVGSASPGWLARWRAGDDEATPERAENVAAFEATPDGGLYIVRRAGGDVLVEHRATRAFAEPPRVLGEVKHAGGVRTAMLHDGSLLIAMFDDRELGGPIGLYRARAAGAGSFEVLQDYPGATSKDAATANGNAKGLRSQIVAVGRIAFLVASPRGAWFATSNLHPTKPREWPPIHVYKLVGDDLAPDGPPFVVPQPQYERPFDACAIGDQLAIGTARGRSVSVTITDGRVAHRVEGLLGKGGLASSLLASPRGDALLIALLEGVARCDVLRPGDARLSEPPYVEPEPVKVPEPPKPPPPPPRTLEEVVDRVRLLHVIHAISELHYGPLPYFGFEGDRARGRFYAHDGSGNHLAVGWDDGGVVACCYDHGFGAPDKDEAKEFWADVADGRRKLGKALARWKPPIHGAAWFSAAEDRDGEAGFSEFAEWVRERDEAKLLAEWQEHHGITEAQLDLARSLVRATASGRHTLTDAEAKIALAHTPGSGAPPNDLVIASASKHLRAVGVDWANVEPTKTKRAKGSRS